MTTLSPFYAYSRRAPIDAALNGLINSFLRTPTTGPQSVRAIAFEVTEQGDTYVVAADVPGFRKEDIEVAIDGGRVTISAETKTARDAVEGERVLYSERAGGRATRSFELGAEIDQARANARYADGVLTLTLPKKIVETRKLLQVQ